MRRFGLLLMVPLFASAGCQSPAVRPDDRAAPASAQQPAAISAAGRPGIDDDRDLTQPGAIERVISAPGVAVGVIVNPIVAVTEEAVHQFTGDNAHRAVVRMEDTRSADNRRTGLNRLLEFSFTSRPPYTRAYESMAEQDEDATVRAAAVRACNRSRDRHAVPVFIQSLSDKSEWVRLEGAKGLANLPDPRAIESLTRVAANPEEVRDVRIAAADALKYYHTLEVARTLSSLLGDRDFSVAWQARRSLVFLTHKDFGYDEASWLGYFTGQDKVMG